MDVDDSPFASRPVAGWPERIAITLLLIGGLLGPPGWIAGVVLLWRSNCWSRRAKLIGTFVIPGGLLTSVIAFWHAMNLTDPSPAHAIADGALVIALFILPLATTAYLSMRLRLN